MRPSWGPFSINSLRGGRRGRKPQTVAALTAALTLVLPLSGEGFALTALAAGKGEVTLQQLPRVSGHDAGGTRQPEQSARPAGSRAMTPHISNPVQWPGQATVNVGLTTEPGSRFKDPSSLAVRAPSTPVILRAIAPDQVGDQARTAAGGGPVSAPSSVEVKVADRAQSAKATVNGLLVGLKRNDGSKDAASVAVSLDYGAIADAFGGSWASRLRLVAMPACALTTPELDQCRTRRPLDSTIDPSAKTISTTVVLPGQTPGSAPSTPDDPPATRINSTALPAAPGASAMVLAAESGADGSQGSFTATDLSASGAWSQSASGAFTYSYPITTPPSLTGPGPGVALSYDSQSVDGKTSARNSQASWIGDGWSYSPGFIERAYKACKNSGIDNSGDQCWAGWNATLSLGSHSGELVRDSSGTYHLQSDDGTRIERLTGASNGLWQGEHFKVTTTDGTAYYLGLGHAPGTTADSPTNSAWATPVYHPNSGDPCYTAAKGKASQCDQPSGWRFNLDFVVDPHGNLQRYDWATETNRYATGGGQATTGGGTLTAYARGGNPSRVSYGYQLADALAGREPSARVTFDLAERCVVSESTCRPENLTPSTASKWPDVPYDLACQDGWSTSGTGPNVCRITSPTFWSTKRLSAIRTELRTAGGWNPVDKYELKHLFSEAGALYDPVTGQTRDKEIAGSLQSVMWFAEIRRTAQDTSAGAPGPATLDPVTFTATEINNRVSGSTASATPLYRPRVIGVNTDTGTSIAISYRDPECDRSKGRIPASADSNTMACYPVYWTPAGAAKPIADWFHKTLVAKVTASDTTKANSPARVTSYDYRDGAAWHRDDSDLTDDQYRTWNDFRGYRTVVTTTGAGGDPISQSAVSYLQGMDGDYLAGGTRRVSRPRNSLGEEITDSNWLAGMAQETITFTQAGGTPIAKQFNDTPGFLDNPVNRPRTAWTSQSGAALSTLPPLEARRVKSVSSRSSSLLSDQSTWLTGRTSTAFDTLGRAVKTETRPDVTTALGQICSTTGYATSPASNPMMTGYPSGTLTVAGPCGTPASATTTISDRRLIYDGSADPGNVGAPGVLGQNGTSVGYVTATQALKSYDAQGNPAYQTLNAQAFDGYGRITRSVDAAGAAELTAFTPASSTLPTEIATTNPLGWTAKSILAPARGLATRAIDANGRVTDAAYDALGRRTAVWLPGNSKDANKKADRTFSYELHGVDPAPSSRANPPSITTTTQLDNGTYQSDVTIYDAFLNPRQSQSVPANGATGRIITSKRYDSQGRVSKTTAAWSDPTTGPGTTLFEEADNTVPSQTRTVYDGVGRTIATKLYAKAVELWQTTTAYPGAERTDTTPPSGGTPSTTYTDAIGRTSASVLHGGTGTGDVTTRYTYDVRGNLSTIADNANNIWTYTYDVRGSLIAQTDPNAGTSSTTYDDLGRVTTTTDARGKQLSYTYDRLDRPVGRYEGTDTTNQTKLLASYTFDTLAKGLPTSTTRYIGGAAGSAYTQKINGYNTRYQPTSTTTTIPTAEGRLAGDYTAGLAYTDNLGLLAGYTYNADGGLPAEKYGYTRDLQGEVIGSGTDSTQLLDLANYNPLGQILLSQYGTRGELMRTAHTYDDTTGQLTTSSIKLQQADANPVSFTSYGYDQIGRLTSASEMQSSGSVDLFNDTQCFHYDGLSRLTEAWTDTAGVSAAGPGQTSHCNNATVNINSLGGPAPYWQSFQYNQLGDRTQQIRHDATGDTSRDITQTNTYNGNGRTPASRPNTLTSTTTRTGNPTTTLTSAHPGIGGMQLCLDVTAARTADGTPVETWTCHGGSAQKWTRPGDGTLRAFGKCARPGATAGIGVGIELGTCDGSAAQQWQDGAGGALVHTASTLCLEIPGWNQNPGTQVGLYYCTGHPNQQWPATANPPTGPRYSTTLTPQYDNAGNTTTRTNSTTTTLPSAIPTGSTPLCLDAYGGHTANGTPVQTWTCHGAASQEWTIGTDGTLRVLGACARPVAGSSARSTQIELWTCDVNDGSQQWRTATNGSLIHKASGMCLDIPWASSSQGTRVALWPCNKNANQKWGPDGTQPTAGATQVLTYDLEGRTETVTTPNGADSATSRYLYDTDGSLLIQRGPDGTLLYLFGGTEQLTLSPDGTTVTGNRYYHQPDGTTAIRSSTGNTTYELTDPQNTSTLHVDATNRTVTRRAFDPYGTPRGTVPASWPDNRGYLGKPVDANSGLNLLGARNYDPTLGRFLTVDPLLQAGNPNQMGGYTYSNNDPVNSSDPTGLLSQDGPLDCSVVQGTSSYIAGQTTCGYPSSGGEDWLIEDIVDCSGEEAGSWDAWTCGMRNSMWKNAQASGCLGGTCGGGAVRLSKTKIKGPEPVGRGAARAEKETTHPDDSPASEKAAARRVHAEAAENARKASLEGGVPASDKQHIQKHSKTSPEAPITPSDVAADAGTGTSQKPRGAKSGKSPSENALPPCKNSFPAGVRVEMVDGTSKPIEDVRVGDYVLAADAETGTVRAEQVTNTIVTPDDYEYTDLTLSAPQTDGTSQPDLHITSTQHHPYWNASTAHWTDAANLHPGDQVQTPDRTTLTVKSLTNYLTRPTTAYNLTVAHLHTYYVLAGTTPVLVHNCNGDDPQSAPGGKNGAALSIKQVKMALGRAGMSVSDYDIVHVPEINTAGDGLPSYGNSPHDGNGMPNLGPRGRPVIQISNMGLDNMDTAVATIFHEIYHHQMFATWPDSMGGTESAAETYGQAMLGVFRRRTG
ncbi:ricin-type beta-trefoil lectin domain protein [Kitasatospora sp. NPDC002040]|uniref:ricin-type beta-trefoil lectin domain protein n=1 Tax=Kitasatospora sp. NPDC002040 TaxID=3154661 RepID=UPI00331B4102